MRGGGEKEGKTKIDENWCEGSKKKKKNCVTREREREREREKCACIYRIITCHRDEKAASYILGGGRFSSVRKKKTKKQKDKGATLKKKVCCPWVCVCE